MSLFPEMKYVFMGILAIAVLLLIPNDRIP